MNVSHFNVQRSIDGKTFENIGSVYAKGDGGYIYSDKVPPPSPKGLLYYRLEMVDNDGSKSYSEIRVVKFTIIQPITIYPNPAHTSVSVQGINVAEIDIVNNVGTTVVSKIVTAGSGSSNTSLSVGALVAGSYTVVVKYNTGCNQSQTLIKY